MTTVSKKINCWQPKTAFTESNVIFIYNLSNLELWNFGYQLSIDESAHSSCLKFHQLSISYKFLPTISDKYDYFTLN